MSIGTEEWHQVDEKLYVVNLRQPRLEANQRNKLIPKT